MYIWRLNVRRSLTNKSWRLKNRIIQFPLANLFYGTGIPACIIVVETREKFAEVPLPVPPIEEQKAIAQILSEMDAEIDALEKRREKYKAIKQGMMQELLTGKTRLV